MVMVVVGWGVGGGCADKGRVRNTDRQHTRAAPTHVSNTPNPTRTEHLNDAHLPRFRHGNRTPLFTFLSCQTKRFSLDLQNTSLGLGKIRVSVRDTVRERSRPGSSRRTPRLQRSWSTQLLSALAPSFVLWRCEASPQ